MNPSVAAASAAEPARDQASQRPVSMLTATRVWLLLICATALSWWLSESHQVAAAWSATAAVLIGGIKARWVFLHYMELAHAPLLWRLVFEAWVLLSVALILAGYWWTV